METNKIYCGDCLGIMKTFPGNSIDSICCDPPYGISFMGKHWDYNLPSVDIWQECLRVLKPGGHLLSACGTRTYHRMACAIEDAGFEIRDCIGWIYGSGFPKSLDISKAIDKRAGAEREQGNPKPYTNDRGMKGNNFGGGEYERIQTYETAPSTPAAKQWFGWGTALKPAMELWTLARKPLSESTVAANVLKYGTGGINIDGCRVEGNYDNSGRNIREEDYEGSEFLGALSKEGRKTRADSNQLGRFPANLIHDGSDEVVRGFPNSKTGDWTGQQKGVAFGHNETGKPYFHKGSDGSASRFFYCAKASKSERNAGLEGFKEKEAKDRNTFTGLPDLRMSHEQNRNKSQNNHPTVKPIALMRYLCRLITPPDGLVLDPFAGSGSTLIAAKLEGFRYIGIEREEEYVRIAKARVDNVQKEAKLW